MKLTKSLLTLFTFAILGSCLSTQSTSVLYSDNYDKSTDKTTVMILPYGSVKVPGKWVKTSENSISGQHFFIGADSVRIAVALQPWDRYEFSYKNPEVTPDNFVKKFYEWEADYFKKQTNGEIDLVIENQEKNYLIWSIVAPTLDEHYLFGLKGKTAFSLKVVADKWDEQKKVDFLTGLYVE
jgi:hypothetical protein